jgi:hypothetical protein
MLIQSCFFTHSLKDINLYNSSSIVFSLILFLVSGSIFGQSSEEYVGALKLNDSTAIPYKIIFEENDGEISGYSITDFSGDHETKSNIKGTYDSNEKMLSFYETGIVYTKSTFVENDFCFIHLEPTKFKLGRTNSLKTNFLGKFSDGTKCIDGEIYLNEIERIEKAVAKLSKKVNKSRRVNDSLKESFNKVSIMDSLRLNVLKKEQTTTFFTKENSVQLSVFDGEVMDDDIITIIVDKKFLLKSHVSTSEKKVFTINLDNDVTNIKFISESIGSLGLNTTMLELTDAEKNKIEAITELNKGEMTEINVVKLRRE